MSDPTDGHSMMPGAADSPSVEMPRPTVWPVVVALAVTLLGAGLATSPVLAWVGLTLFIAGISGWVRQLLPGVGHTHEPLVEPAHAHREIVGEPGMVEQLHPGMAGYRFQLPLAFHPISSGVKGGIVGGLVMPIPALLYGILSDQGIWFPVNLLAGIVIPGISGENIAQLRSFQLSAFIVAVVIHAIFSLTFGLLFGVVSPTLPQVPAGPVIAGGVLMPFLWSGLCHGFMGIINPSLQKHVNWFWFVVSQVVYGVAMSIVVARSQKVSVPPVGSGPRAPEVIPESSAGGGNP